MNRNEIIGIGAGVISGAAYGLNPVFGKPLMAKGVSIPDMLFVRYGFALLIITVIAFARSPKGTNPFSVKWNQLPMLTILGVLFTLSSVTLFDAYSTIPSGVAATLVYLYPVFTALFLMFVRVFPSWKTVVAIVCACIGVSILCLPGSSGEIKASGVIMSICSAIVYALYLILIGRSKRVANLGVQTITLYALIVGTIIFWLMSTTEEIDTLELCTTAYDWFNLIGLAIFPTAIAVVGLSVATRRIGATRAAVLGVFEPITSIVFGILLFNEPFTLLTATGMIICLVAMLFIKD